MSESDASTEVLVIGAGLVFNELRSLPQWVEDQYGLIIDWRGEQWSVVDVYGEDTVEMYRWNGRDCVGDVVKVTDEDADVWRSLLEVINETEPRKI